MSAPLRLSDATLRRLPPTVRTPLYDRRGLVPSLMHIGVGGFFRAHQAVYLDDLIALTSDRQWAYCGIGLLEQDASMRDALRSQDCLYTVLERGPQGDSARVVGSVVEYVHAPEDRELVLARLASPNCRIVTLTITEGGYYRNEATGAFQDTHPDIVYDLAHPHEPRCSFGYLVESLDRRRRAGLGPLTVFSCDDLQHNGRVARRMPLAFAELRDPALRRWIEDHVAFPGCMVDCIVPATTQERRDVVAGQFGVADAWPVGTEPFSQWVIEDFFPNGRPSWKRVGARMTTNLEPYERMKMRLLDGSHLAMCYIGMLLGYEFAHEAIGDPAIRILVQRLMEDEVTPLLATPEGVDLALYKRTLLERLANPTIRDPLARIGTDGSVRMPRFVMPSIAEQLKRGGPIDASCFTVAAWLHCLAGRDDRGRPLAIVDAMKDSLVAAASDARPGFDALFGLAGRIDGSLLQSARFRGQVTSVLQGLRESGGLSTLQRFLATTRSH